MFRFVPPAGTPTPISAVLLALLEDSGQSQRQFDEAIHKVTGAKYRFFLSSGRAAQTLILRAMRLLAGNERTEVVIPGYTCFTVAASVARAGLRIRPVDITPETLDYNFDCLKTVDFSQVLAVNASNLFGLVSDFTHLRQMARENSVYIVDDAAQSFGTVTDEGPSGTLGDAGFYSLDRGKNLSTYSGGILVTSSSSLAERIEQLLASEIGEREPSALFTASRLALYGWLLHPRWYWIPASLPFLGLGETVYDEEFVISKGGRLQAALGVRMLPRLADLNRTRAQNALRLGKPLVESGKYTVPGFNAEKPVAYLRLPVLCRDSEARDQAIRRLRKAGVAATAMYPAAIQDIKGISSRLAPNVAACPGAREVVKRLFTLPTHPYVTMRDIEKVVSCLL